MWVRAQRRRHAVRCFLVEWTVIGVIDDAERPLEYSIDLHPIDPWDYRVQVVLLQRQTKVKVRIVALE